MSTAIKYTGLFQMWSYTVSHKRLLLRRAKRDPESTQIDIMFKDVSAVLLVPTINNIEISEMQKLGDSCVPAQLGYRDVDGKIYEITGDNFCGFVIAATIVVDESERRYWEPSPLLDG